MRSFVSKTSTLICLVGVLLFAENMQAQGVPQSFNYQAAVRDTAGLLVTNQAVSVRVNVIADSANGTTVYQELQTATTTDFGLMVLNVGEGTPVVGTFAGVSWGSAIHFLDVEIDETGGSSYSSLGMIQLLSVPYALYAEAAGATSSTAWTINGNDVHNALPGNVGIGLNAPEELLAIQGNDPIFYIETSDTAIASGNNIGKIEFRGLDDSLLHRTGARILVEAAASWGDGHINDAPTRMRFFTQSDAAQNGFSSHRMLIDATGNIAIGPDDDSPDALLHVVDDQAGTTEIRIDNGSADSTVSQHTALKFFDGASEQAFLTHDNFNNLLQIGTTDNSEDIHFINDSVLTLVMDDGNVVIGPDDLNPDALLHVVRDDSSTTEIRIDNSNSDTLAVPHTALTFYDGPNEQAFIKHDNQANLLSFGTTKSSEDIHFINDSTLTMVMENGNIAIGPDDLSPESLLHVVKDLSLIHI